MELVRFETLTFRNYTFSDATFTLSDINVVLCYVLSQYHFAYYALFTLRFMMYRVYREAAMVVVMWFPADPRRHGVRLRRAEMDVQDHHCHTYAATNRYSALSLIFRNMVSKFGAKNDEDIRETFLNSNYRTN